MRDQTIPPLKSGNLLNMSMTSFLFCPSTVCYQRHCLCYQFIYFNTTIVLIYRIIPTSQAAKKFTLVFLHHCGTIILGECTQIQVTTFFNILRIFSYFIANPFLYIFAVKKEVTFRSIIIQSGL